MTDVHVRDATVEDAGLMRDVIREAFSARPRLDPPSTAPAETPESIAAVVSDTGGLVCFVDGRPAGALLFADAGSALGLRRVSVLPRFQRRGVASAIVGAAELVAAQRGYDDVRLRARAELPATLTFWHRRGYAEVARTGSDLTLAKALPVEVEAATAEDCRQVGERIGRLVEAGDVVILIGELGAGKTTLTQGIGSGLQVRGDVTSPTFVISRIHPSLDSGPSLVHVDAYRLGDEVELDDLDLDAYVDAAVTVVEWGEGIAEALSEHRLEVRLSRSRGDDVGGETRTITLTPVGSRWVGAGVRSSLSGIAAHQT